ncbi:SGF29 tudor-like domain-containing protein [Limtongia smithiae]|uniref:SGF29 tudor-like domain-containing protein n=1 Tax=Limtongia smithiae TaxID=1125753 RepID=UPI0034CE4C21
MAARIRSRPSSVSQYLSSQSSSGVDSSGEADVWNKICEEIRNLSEYATMNESAKLAAANVESSMRRITALATVSDDSHMIETATTIVPENIDDVKSLLTELEQMRELYQKQTEYATAEKAILDQATEDVSILSALRQATETMLSESKRKKRKVEDIATVDTPKVFKKARSSSVVPVEIPAVGSQVAFRPKKQKGADAEWIQCEITKIMGDGSKVRYEVQDPEPDENNNPGQMYKAGPKDIILISSNSADLQPYPTGTRVLARYPETTTFYRAEVIGTKRDGTCRLKFEGEEEVGKETEVERRLVLEMPK